MTGQPPKPETQAQAERWNRVCRLAERAGLCSRCSSQFAWGIQGGFATVKEPCAACTIVMLDWPVVRPNGWHSPGGDVSARGTWASVGSTERTAPRDGDAR